MPMKLSGGSGAPVRVVAILDDQVPQASSLVASKTPMLLVDYFVTFLSVSVAIGSKMLVWF